MLSVEICPSQKDHAILLPHFDGVPSRTEAWFALGVGWKKLTQFSAAQQSPFLTKNTGREEPRLVSLTVHTLYGVVSRLSRREVRQKHGRGE